MVRFTKNFLSNRTASSRYNGEFSDPYSIKQGVPQEGPSSCDYFNIYIGDVPQPDENSGTEIQQFADDTKIYTIHKNKRTAEKKQQKYINEKLEPWLSNWRIPVNPQKSEAMVYFHHSYTMRHKDDSDRFRLTLQGQEVKRVD